MKVILQEYGGLAAGIRRLPVSVDTHHLSAPAARELIQLVQAAKSAPAPGGSGPGRARDTMAYTITVEDDGHSTVLSETDETISNEFADLLNWLKTQPATR